MRNEKYSGESSLNSQELDAFINTFKSQMLRGIGTICILHIIKRHGSEGAYGYEISNELSKLTENKVIIEGGTIYPMLNNLVEWTSKKVSIKLLETSWQPHGKRMRKYYKLSDKGEQIYFALKNVFGDYFQAVLNLIDGEMDTFDGNFFFCPNCGIKIEYSSDMPNFCEGCGYGIGETKKMIQTKQTTEEKI